MRRDMRLLRLFHLVAFLAALGLVAGGLASCAQPTPEVVKETVVVPGTPEVIKETVVVPATPEPPKKPIRIGTAQPYSGSFAYIGLTFNKGLNLAIEEINAEGGILGHPVELYPCDNELANEKSVACVRRLTELHQVDLIIGMGGSGTVLAGMPAALEAQVPVLVPDCTSVAITAETGVGGNEWLFRANPNDDMMAEAMARYLAAELDTVSLIAMNNDWGRGGIATARAKMEELGVEILSEDYYEAGEADYRPLLSRIKGLDPKAVYLMMYGRDAGPFLRQFQELGMTQEIYARGSVVSQELLDAISDDLSLGEGIVEVAMHEGTRDPGLQARWIARYGEPLHFFGIGPYQAMRYVAAAAIENAIAETGEATPSSIRDALENVSVDTTLWGHVEFDEHNQAHPPIPVLTIQDGEIVLVELIPSE